MDKNVYWKEFDRISNNMSEVLDLFQSTADFNYLTKYNELMEQRRQLSNTYHEEMESNDTSSE